MALRRACDAQSLFGPPCSDFAYTCRLVKRRDLKTLYVRDYDQYARSGIVVCGVAQPIITPSTLL